MERFPERLRDILQAESLTSTAFAEILGIQRSGLSHLLNGRNKPSLELIEKIHTHFPSYSYAFLIEGVTEPAQNHGENIDVNKQNINNIENTPSKPTENVKINVTDVTLPKNVVKIAHYYEDGSFELFYPSTPKIVGNDS